MTKIDIISGFLGAGKTTLIKKLLSEALKGQKIVLIENEFGEIGIDGGFLKEAGIQITEMNSGCICCSLVGDFGKALTEVIEKYTPDRIIIEPSGVGKLSDVISAVKDVAEHQPVVLNSFVTVADAVKYKMYSKNFGEFFLNQIENAGAIFLSRTQNLKEDKLSQCVHTLQHHNPKAKIVTTPWDMLTGEQLLSVMEDSHTLVQEMLEQMHSEHHHHDHDHEHSEGCGCGGHHHHDHDHEHGEGCGCGGHHHHHDHDHEHGEGCGCGGHHHHDHEHGEGCGCGGHHHHDHHADEVFQSWGVETPKKFTEQQLKACLTALNDEKYGTILRAKGIIPCADSENWIHFDYVPESFEIRHGSADYTGRLCVIGANLDQDALAKLFEI